MQKNRNFANCMYVTLYKEYEYDICKYAKTNMKLSILYLSLIIIRKYIVNFGKVGTYLLMYYTQSPFIRTSLIRISAEFLGKFKTRALGAANLRTTSKNLRTASAQIFKAKNQFVDESIVDGPQKRSK